MPSGVPSPSTAAIWAPVLKSGKPCPDRRGVTFRHCVREIERAGCSTGMPSTAPLTLFRSPRHNPRQKIYAGSSAMQVVKLKHVKRYRSKGRDYWYHRITRERLPDDETARVQRVLHLNATLEGWSERTIAGSIGDLVSRYRASPEFKRLAPRTRSTYMESLGLLEEGSADVPITEIDIAWLYALRDSMADTPRAADKMLAMMSVLLNFAVVRGFCQDNPVRHVKKLHGGKSFEPWTEAAIERFRAGANPRMVWAMELALFTGQRRSDVLAMRWSHIEDGLIEVAQQKTGERLHIPVHPQLADLLAGSPRPPTPRPPAAGRGRRPARAKNWGSSGPPGGPRW